VALSWNNFKAAFRYDIVWRTGIFLVALALLIIITTRWNRWEGDSRWQSTDDAYLQSDLTPISAKVAGYIRALPVQNLSCESQRGNMPCNISLTFRVLLRSRSHGARLSS
jgi:hypothetical protein